MKIAFFADLHIGNYNEFNHHNSRLNRCLTALDLIYQKAKIRGCEIVVDTGDLIDKKNLLDFKVYNEIYHAFSEISKNYNLPTFSLVGNHNISIQGRPDVNNLVPLMEFLTPVDTTAWIPWPGKEPQVYLGFIPYQHDLDQWYNEQEWLLQHFPTDTTKPCLLVGHQELKGAVTGTHRYVAGSGIDHRPSLTIVAPISSCRAPEAVTADSHEGPPELSGEASPGSGPRPTFSRDCRTAEPRAEIRGR